MRTLVAIALLTTAFVGFAADPASACSVADGTCLPPTGCSVYNSEYGTAVRCEDVFCVWVTTSGHFYCTP